jgi:hypothetical protein
MTSSPKSDVRPPTTGVSTGSGLEVAAHKLSQALIARVIGGMVASPN